MASVTLSDELHVRIPILGMGCAASEALSLEHRLVRIPAVLQVYVNPTTEAVYLQCEPAHYDPNQILETIVEAGLRPGKIELR